MQLPLTRATSPTSSAHHMARCCTTPVGGVDPPTALGGSKTGVGGHAVEHAGSWVAGGADYPCCLMLFESLTSSFGLYQKDDSLEGMYAHWPYMRQLCAHCITNTPTVHTSAIWTQAVDMCVHKHTPRQTKPIYTLSTCTLVGEWHWHCIKGDCGCKDKSISVILRNTA